MFLDFAQQRRDNQDAADEPHRERDGQHEHLVEQFSAFELMADGDTGEQHHQHYCHYILHNQDAGSTLNETLLAHACLVDDLHHDRGARHAEHACQEQRVDHIQSGIVAHQVAPCHHTQDDGHGANGCHLAAADEVLEAELQTDAEQHKQHADVAPGLHVFLIHKGLAKQVRAYQHTGHDITQHHWLLQKLKNDTDHSSRDHQDI